MSSLTPSLNAFPNSQLHGLDTELGSWLDEQSPFYPNVQPSMMEPLIQSGPLTPPIRLEFQTQAAKDAWCSRQRSSSTSASPELENRRRDGKSSVRKETRTRNHATKGRQASGGQRNSAGDKLDTRQLDLMRNRMSAKRFQEKRKMQEAALQGRVQELAASNAYLKAEAADLQNEINQLQIQCIQQVGCHCGTLQPFLGNDVDEAIVADDYGWSRV